MALSTNKDVALRAWKQKVLQWYPYLHLRAYFVPPVHMMGINFKMEDIAGQLVAVPGAAIQKKKKGDCESVSESEVMEDWEQQRILHCLKKFCEKRSECGMATETTSGEVMFVLSQLKFIHYLGESCFAGAAEAFPRTKVLKTQEKDRGDFDILIIHRHYGLLAAEIKSVGTRFTGSKTDDDTTLVDRLNKIIKQLTKSGDVLRHLTSDMPHQPRITTTMMLPNIAADHLKRVLTDNPQVRQALCTCFGIPDTRDPLDFCLTSEQLSDRMRFWEVTDDVMKALEQWRTTVMSGKGEEPAMTEEVYEELVARFAGPATTVKVFCPSAVSQARSVVRTEGQGVAETAARFTDLVLYQQQINILQSGRKLVYLTGPPGTGKTVVLMLQAEQWLKEGHEVHVVSMYDESIAASVFVVHSLRTKFPGAMYNIHLHSYNLDHPLNVEEVRNLAALAQNGQLYVIVDEVDGGPFKEFFNELSRLVNDLHLWAARIYHSDIPSSFEEFSLSVPLRSPSVVTREIQNSHFVNKYGQVRKYDEEKKTYTITDGPSIRKIRHEGSGHADDVMPRDCEACGAQLAAVLKEFHVGDGTDESERRVAAPSEANPQDPVEVKIRSTLPPDPLHYRDVFLLHLYGFQDEGVDDEGRQTPSSGIVKGLRQAGVPVTVLTEKATINNIDLVTDVATMKGSDSVIATSSQCISGLERKIVAWVQSGDSDMSGQFDKLLAFSRTSAQLILIFAKEQAAAENLGPMPTENMETETESEPDIQAFENNMVDLLIDLGRECITEDILREVNAVLQFYLIQQNGVEHPVYIDLRPGGSGVQRGEVSGTQIAGVFRVPSSDLLLFLRGDRMGAFTAVTQDRIQVTVNNSRPLLRLDQFWTEIAAVYESRFGPNN